MNTTTILQYMKKHGQKLDREIAKDTCISLIQVRLTIAELQDIKQVSSCNVINFEDGVAIEGILCRFSGYIPPAAPGRKAAAQTAVAV
jgi:transcription initiation factor IIE alpha subunit